MFGTLEIVNDVRLPGMLHARMIRPPVAGAVPVKVDESSIKDIPGAKVVWIKDLLAVVAEKEWNAVKAAQALKVTWSESQPNFPGHDKLHDHIRKAPVIKRGIQRENGNVEEGLKQAVRVIEGEYEFPTQSHASMGPACAVADVRDGEATIWTSHAEALRFARRASPSCSACRATRCARSGCSAPARYGRNDQGDATADAAVLSQHLGRPVRVQYMRHEQLGWDPKGTACGQPRPRRARCVGQGDRLRVHQQGVLAHRHQYAREPRRRRAGRTSARSAAQARSRISKSRSRPTPSTTAGSAGTSFRR